jgi:hypothetical protein
MNGDITMSRMTTVSARRNRLRSPGTRRDLGVGQPAESEVERVGGQGVLELGAGLGRGAREAAGGELDLPEVRLVGRRAFRPQGDLGGHLQRGLLAGGLVVRRARAQVAVDGVGEPIDRLPVVLAGRAAGRQEVGQRVGHHERRAHLDERPAAKGHPILEGRVRWER